MTVFVGTFVAPLTGVKDVTVGAVVSAVGPVVNVLDTAVTALPATSCTPVEIATLFGVLAGSGSTGVKVTYVFVESNVIVVGIWVDEVPKLSETVVEFTVIGLIGLLNVITTKPFRPTFC
jgi:hypothetical protein